MDKRNHGWMNAAVFALLLLISGALGAQTKAQPQQNPDLPKGMKQYFFGFLVKGEKWTETLPKEERELLMQKHLAYIQSQAEAGKYALAGPFLDDDRIRGFLIINAASAEEARNIVSGDPMVQSGRMAVEVHPAMFADVSCVMMEYRKSVGK